MGSSVNTNARMSSNLCHRPSHRDGNLSHRPSHRDGNLSHRPSHAGVEYMKRSEEEEYEENNFWVPEPADNISTEQNCVENTRNQEDAEKNKTDNNNNDRA